MTDNKTFSAGGVVVNSEGNVLLVQEYGYYWGLPRGHIEEGETPLQAAEREIYEEAGIKHLKFVKELGSYERYRFDKDGNENYSELKHITLFLFTTGAQEPDIHDKNITAAEWVEPEKVIERLIYFKDINFYKSCLKEIEGLVK